MSVRTNEPTVDASHVREFKHSGHMIQQLTIILGIGPEVHLLDHSVEGAKLVKEKLLDFFSRYYGTVTEGNDLFLPPQFTPLEILSAAQNFAEGKKAYTAADEYVRNHVGVVVLEITDVYFFRQQNSWSLQCWILDCDHPENIGIDYLIKNDLTEDAGDAVDDSVEITEHIINESNNTVFYQDADGLVGFCEPGADCIRERIRNDKAYDEDPFLGIQRIIESRDK